MVSIEDSADENKVTQRTVLLRLKDLESDEDAPDGYYDAVPVDCDGS